MLALSALIERYQKISEHSSVLDVDIENEKKKILEEVLAHLVQDAPRPFRTVAHKKERETGKNPHQYAYCLLLCFGVLEDVANSYFMGSALFLLLLPNLSAGALFIASLIYASIEGFLFYAFDSYELRKAMGINETTTSLGELLHLCEEELRLTRELNLHLSMISTLNISDERYRSYLVFLSLVHRDLKSKENLMNAQSETFFHRLLRGVVMMFGAISSLAGSYFMVTTLMALCAVSMSTPISLALIISTMILGLVFHYWMGSTSLTRMVNPHYEKFHQLKEELELFEQTHAESGELLLQQRERYKKSVSGFEKVAPHSLFKPRSATNNDVFNRSALVY